MCEHIFVTLLWHSLWGMCKFPPGDSAISLSLDWIELDSFVQVTYSSVYRGTVYFLGCMVLRPWNRKGQCCFNPFVFLNLENYLFILLFSANWK
uniref:Putative ovule protein n=1 Tax=Solanum chacoense TaxID=4108 RepID=A0A0V0H191_SOLCH